MTTSSSCTADDQSSLNNQSSNYSIADTDRSSPPPAVSKINSTLKTQKSSRSKRSKDTTTLSEPKTVVKVSRKVLYPSATSAPTVSMPFREKQKLKLRIEQQKEEPNHLVNKSKTSRQKRALSPHPPSESTLMTTMSTSASGSKMEFTTSQSSVTLIVMPRLLKSDLRRQYARMFANVMNSHDSLMMQSFLAKYAKKEVIMDKIMAPGACRNDGSDQLVMTTQVRNPCKIHLTGVDEITGYWHALHSLTPDQVLYLEETQVRTRPGSMACKITCKFKVEGTILVDKSKGDVMPQVMAHIMNTIHRRQQSTSSALDIFNHLATIYGPEVLQKTSSLCGQGDFIVYIDDDRRIEKLELLPRSV
jgi:hypothetical protein